MSPKVVVIGVDGATPQLMKQWMDAGQLPTFQMLRSQGVWGKLRSTIPPFSAPAWSSIVTGCNPGKHGIYGFETLTDVNPHLISSRNRKVPAFWNYLTSINHTSIIVNVPGSYPPERIKGNMVTGLLTPSPDSRFTFPSSLKHRLNKQDLGEYPLESIWLEDFSRSRLAKTNPMKLVSILINQLESRAQVTTSLMRETEWDFTMVVFRATDTAQHFLFDQLEYVRMVYQKVDELIKQLIDSNPDATFFIVSDHGFERINKILHPDNVLFKAGYLKPTHIPTHRLSQLWWTIYTKVGRYLLKLIPANFIKHSQTIKKMLFSSAAKDNIFDFSETRAFSTAEGRGIQINQKKRYNEGIVDDNEYEPLRDDIIKLFHSLQDPETKKHFVHHVYRGADIYGSDAVDSLDLVLDLAPHYTASESLRFPEKNVRRSIKNKKLFPVLFDTDTSGRSGDHAQHGIFFGYGANIKSNIVIDGLSVFDVLPTVFASLGFSPPAFIDGKTKNQIFKTTPNLKDKEWMSSKSNQLLTTAEKEKIKSLHKNLFSQ